MVGITAVIALIGIVLVRTVAIQAEEDLHAKFSQLESQVKSLSQRLTQEEEYVFRLQRQDELFKQQLENCTAFQSKRFEDVIEKFQRRAKRSVLDLSGRQSRSFSSTDPDEVAFTAQLDHELTNVPIHTTIKFDFVIHHTDDYYDPNTGVFTCPTSGLYLFAVFIEPSDRDIESAVNVMMDGKSYISVIAEISTDDEDITGGNVVLLSVNKGQRVWVETDVNDNQSFWKGFTTFSGVLIHRT